MSVNQNNSVTAADSNVPHRVPRELEGEFQDDYYRKLLPGLRSGMLVFVLVHLLLALYYRVSHGAFSNAFLPEASVGAVVFLLTFWPAFRACWQPVIFALFSGLITYLLITMRAPPAAATLNAPAVNVLEGLMRPGIPVIVYGFVLTRVQFRWFLPGALLVFLLGVAVAIASTGLPLAQILPAAILGIASPTAALMYASYIQEQTSRREFIAQHLLAQERNNERRQREQSDSNLRVLGQAIGGIVHDLGNPLATVYTGVATIELILQAPQPDMSAMREFSGMVSEGAEMLNFLRLSLMEQTRVLEGKPIPVVLKATAAKAIVESGARFQNPRFLSGHTITIPTDSVEIYADPMKLTTVFMNLIGNALKYSDAGEVRVLWHPYTLDNGSADKGGHRVLLIAILDPGTGSRGITEAQARQLFVPFGRLDTHATVEGTGLGLLSVLRIVEAHGGEVYIEGTVDGRPGSSGFSTAKCPNYPALLTEPFRTAFVVTCPTANNP